MINFTIDILLDHNKHSHLSISYCDLQGLFFIQAKKSSIFGFFLKQMLDFSSKFLSGCIKVDMDKYFIYC